MGFLYILFVVVEVVGFKGVGGKERDFREEVWFLKD